MQEYLQLIGPESTIGPFAAGILLVATALVIAATCGMLMGFVAAATAFVIALAFLIVASLRATYRDGNP